MSLKKITTEVTYKVPAWGYCNLQGNAFGQPSKEKCRFCVKDGKNYRCALYNAILDVHNGTLIEKNKHCERATAGFNSIVTDVTPEPREPVVDPKRLMKTTMKLYVSTKKKLLAQGYPEPLADQAAQEFVLGESRYV